MKKIAIIILCALSAYAASAQVKGVDGQVIDTTDI